MNTALCSSFGSCASCVLELDYKSQKELKIARTKELFSDIWQACGFADECCFLTQTRVHFARALSLGSGMMRAEFITL